MSCVPRHPIHWLRITLSFIIDTAPLITKSLFVLNHDKVLETLASCPLTRAPSQHSCFLTIDLSFLGTSLPIGRYISFSFRIWLVLKSKPGKSRYKSSADTHDASAADWCSHCTRYWRAGLFLTNINLVFSTSTGLNNGWVSRNPVGSGSYCIDESPRHSLSLETWKTSCSWADSGNSRR